jgi:hypothetical protein
MAKAYCKFVRPGTTYTQTNMPQMASNSRNRRRRAHRSIGRLLHSTMLVLCGRMYHLLLQVLYMLLPKRQWAFRT